MRRDRRPLVLALALALTIGFAARADDPAGPAGPAATLAKIRDAALSSDWAWQQLTALTDQIGPRLTGSPQAEAAVAQVAAVMKAEGFQVTLQPVQVPRWVRGDAQAELVDYPGRPAGVVQHLHLTALGGSAATPLGGLTAPVVVVPGVDALAAAAPRLRGAIVLIDTPFDQHLADNGRAGTAYRQAGRARFVGPAAAARYGAAAVLVRSVGGADFRLPHTGFTRVDPQHPEPAAALAAEDAGLIERLAAHGPVTMHLALTPQRLPDITSHNVIADLKGSAEPDQVVILSGHLDSWDLGTGAVDDGAGLVSAMAAAVLIRQLGLVPRRTLRVIAWMNEEDGTRGAKAYFASVKDRLATQFAAIESDNGAGQPLGIRARLGADDMDRLEVLRPILSAFDATAFEHSDEPVGEDIEPLERAGVPGFMPLLDIRHYFDIHHTAADTLDKVDPELLQQQVAVMATLAWHLANLVPPLPRLPVAAGP